ncbi:MAG TPA: hypothetical protein VK832_14845 [Burkholderiaceae bacterium]|jgi:hypothetical protein|nr:hypothetical protein [Burkholderiaceae bacterium]
MNNNRKNADPDFGIVMHEEARIMWTKKFALILSMALPAIAYADNEGGNASPLPTQNPPSKVTSHIDYLGTGFFNSREKSASAEPVPRQEDGIVVQSRSSFPLGNQSSSLHWEQGEQHPVLEYRLSDQGTLYFHVSKHGTTAGAQWKF